MITHKFKVTYVVSSGIPKFGLIGLGILIVEYTLLEILIFVDWVKVSYYAII